MASGGDKSHDVATAGDRTDAEDGYDEVSTSEYDALYVLWNIH